MPLIEITTLIDVPIEVIFDLARDIDAHQKSASQTQEVVIAGKTSGLLELGETVTWQARHLGIQQRLTVKMTQLEHPHFFEDQMIAGAFAHMKHKHYFHKTDTGTRMIDQFEFSAPFGFIGRLFEKLYLTRYMKNFLIIRNQQLKHLAETRN